MSRGRTRGAGRRRPAARAVSERWLVEKLVPGGEGLCRGADGLPGFVAGGFPGDLLDVTEVEEHKRYRRARAYTLVERGPERVDAPCPVAQSCGGCDWMALSRPAQLEWKRRLVVEALRRTGGITDVTVGEVVTAGEVTGYRRRVRLQVAGGRFGFFRPGSHELVEIAACPVAHPALNDALSMLEELLGDAHGVQAVELRVDSEGCVVARLLGRVDEAQARRWALAGRSRGLAIVVGDDGPLQRFALPGGVSLSVEPGAFSQVNWDVNLKLVQALVEGAVGREARTFADLFAGAGNFTLPLLAAGLEGTAVERSPASSRSAERVAKEAGWTRGTFITDDAAHAANALVQARRTFDLVVLDPPRTGARGLLDAVSRLSTAHIAYVSCDPVTLARDLADLTARGCRVESILPFDMFPHTHHVEVLCWLRREQVGA